MHLSVNVSMSPYRPHMADSSKCYFRQFRSEHPWWSRALRHSEVYQSHHITDHVIRWLSGPLMLDQAPLVTDRRLSYSAFKDGLQQGFQALWNHDDKVTRPITTALGHMALAACCVAIGLLSALYVAQTVGCESIIDSTSTFGGSLGLIGFLPLFLVLTGVMYWRTSYVSGSQQSAGLLIAYCLNLSLLTSCTLTLLFFKVVPWLYFLVGSPFTVEPMGFGALGLFAGLLAFFITKRFLERHAEESSG